MITDALQLQVLSRFGVELAEADTLQLVHLAQRAEGRYTTELGDRMRELVDHEKARRAFGLAPAAKASDLIWVRS